MILSHCNRNTVVLYRSYRKTEYSKEHTKSAPSGALGRERVDVQAPDEKTCPRHVFCGLWAAVLFESCFYEKKMRHAIRRISFLGGSGWIRTTEVVDNRFTVCPLWPLGNAPLFSCDAAEEGGAGRRTRTPDLLITNQLLYQLSYTSTSATEIILPEDSRFVNRYF